MIINIFLDWDFGIVPSGLAQFEQAPKVQKDYLRP